MLILAIDRGGDKERTFIPDLGKSIESKNVEWSRMLSGCHGRNIFTRTRKLHLNETTGFIDWTAKPSGGPMAQSSCTPTFTA